MVARVEAEEVSRMYESDSDNEVDTESINIGAPPVHPIPSMQGAFEESIVESIEEQNDPKIPDATLGPKARRQKMIEQDDYDETYNAQWRRKPQARYHPLWKLMAQISFGVHLLQQRLAKSDEEVVKILQKHVDEVDTHLEKTTEDFDLAYLDIKERINYLKLPLEHVNIFDIMLDDKQFRTSIIEGNEKIEKICNRTARAMNDSLVDVSKGIEAVTELATYLNGVREKWADTEKQTQAIYNAMRGNAEGWYRCFRALQVKGNDLGLVLGQLGNILNEMSKRAGVASRRAAPSRGSDRPTSRSDSPAIPTPSSRYSSLRVNTDNKPLPRPPRSGSETPLRLETPSVVSPRPSSRAQSSHSQHSPHSPHSPHSYSPRTHSPLAQSPQTHSPLAQSPRAQSPAAPKAREAAPFEGKFEQARAAPKPPLKKEILKKQPTLDESSEDISALPQRPSIGFSRRGSALNKDSKESGVRRSGSIIRRLRAAGSKDVKVGTPIKEQPGKYFQQKHERSMTSDLADLFRVAGESPRNSRVIVEVEESTRPRNKLRKKSADLVGATLSPKKPSQQLSKGVGAKLAPSPLEPADSAYSSGEGEGHKDTESLNEVHRADSNDRNGIGGPVPQRKDSLPVQGASPTLARDMSPVPPTSVSPTHPPRTASPNPHSLQNGSPRPHTPTTKFGLFPPSRPLTPSAMSVHSSAGALEGTSNRESPLLAKQRQRNSSLSYTASVVRAPGRSSDDDSAPAPGVPRNKRGSGAAIKSGVDAYAEPNGSDNKENNVGAPVLGGLGRKTSLAKKKGSFGRLRDWMGRRGNSTSLRDVRE
ncbi:hypothetical protein NA57DRAFT_75584 [Rhizodiscina lignyota]|uniref:Karyogamy protein n=1 Tax=Rhizodiscina lignyota TaxID=1504668 RepID=A0A9P4IKC8_9PEZI|nr:hypothetical protein NA57DRAFT_75584 [Rhizodiscina lignyota]